MARVRSGRLALAIFLVSLLAVAAAVGLPALLAVAGSTARPGDTAAATLGRGHAALAGAERQRLERLALTARLLAREGALIDVLGGAGDEEIDGAAALADLLAQRRPELGFDLALVLDREGRVLGAVGDGVAVGSDLSGDPLVAVALDEGAAAGTWELASGLAHVAVEPVAPDFDLLGHLLVGAALDEVFALEVGRASGAGVTLVRLGGEGAAEASASNLGDGEVAAVATALAAPGALAAGLRDGATPETTVDAPGGARRVMIVPLAAAGTPVVGAALLSSPTTGAGRVALPPLVAAAGLGLLLALLLAPLVARRALAPATRLVEVVEAAPRESFARRLEARRYRALSPLAAALDRMFRVLHEERSLTAAVAAAHRRHPPTPVVAEPVAESAAVVAFELRRHGRSGDDPRRAAAGLADDLDRLRRAVTAAGGRLVAGAGHRALAVFTGESAVWAAVSGAAVALDDLARAQSAADDAEVAAAAVADGRVLRADDGSGLLAGPAVSLAESVLRETSAGELAMTRAVQGAVGDRLDGHGVVASQQRGLLSPQPLYVLPAAALATLAAALGPSPAGPGAVRPGAVRRGATGPVPGDRFAGRHQVVSRQGVSPGAELWRLRSSEGGGPTALKWMPEPDPAALGDLRGLDGPLERHRRCEHPGLAAVLEVGEAGGGVFLVREWIEGVPLADLGEIAVPAALAVARQLAGAVAALHAEGLAHGRLKPENVVVEIDGRVRLVDHGVAVVAGAAPSASAGDRLVPPEQRGLPAGGAGPAVPGFAARGDVYALAVLIHRLVLGAWPGEEGGEGVAAPPPGLPEVLVRALAEDPEARTAQAGELASALEGIVA